MAAPTSAARHHLWRRTFIGALCYRALFVHRRPPTRGGNSSRDKRGRRCTPIAFLFAKSV